MRRTLPRLVPVGLNATRGLLPKVQGVCRFYPAQVAVIGSNTGCDASDEIRRRMAEKAAQSDGSDHRRRNFDSAL
jgi:hypothetical protein